MKLEEFNYDLPKELIAQEPAEPRDVFINRGDVKWL